MHSATYRELVALVTEALATSPSLETITYLLFAAEPLLNKRIVYTGTEDGEPVFELADWEDDARGPNLPRRWNRGVAANLGDSAGYEIQAHTSYNRGSSFFGRALASLLIAHVPEIFSLAKPLLTFAAPGITAETVEFRIDYRTSEFDGETPIHYWEVEISTNAATENSAGITVAEDEDSPVSRFITSLFQPLFEAAGFSEVEPAIGQDLWDRGELPIAILRRPKPSELVAF